MKKAKILSGVLLLCFSSPLISQAATLDVRGGYRSGSHAYETRLKVSEGWQNGWWASMESNTWNTIHDNKKKMPHSMMFRLKLITRLNLMINGRCAREC